MNVPLRRCNFCLLLVFACCANLLFFPKFAFAQNGAAVKSTFTDLDDEAEAGGYNVSAQLNALPVEWSLARQENGDGYYINFSPDAVSLSVQSKGAKVLLARSTGDFAAAKTAPAVVVLQRRANRWNIIWQNRVVLRAEDDQFQEGPIGWRGAAGAVQDAEVQPTTAPFFDDDFMRVSEKAAYEKAKPNPRNGMVIHTLKLTETIWSTVAGSWKTTGIMENNEQAQVAESANPFAFESGAKGENLAFAGQPFWSDYSFSAAVKPQGASALGLIIYTQDAQNYLLFEWRDDGRVQLCAVVGGKTLILAGSTYDAFGMNQWYRLECKMHSGKWRASIDGHQVLSADTGWFGQGRVGVYSVNATPEKNAAYDDIHIRDARDVLDDFSAPVPGRWRVTAGNWNWRKGASPLNSVASIALMGEKSWSNYGIDCSAFLPQDGAVGLILNSSDKGYYLFRVSGSKAKTPDAGTAELILSQGKTSKILARIKTGAQFDDKSTLWSFEEENGYLKVTTGEGKTMLLDAYDETLSAGQPGIYAKKNASTAPRFNGVLVHFPEERQVWAKVPELYVDPLQAETMGEWSTPQGAWIPVSPTSPKAGTVAAKDAKTLWNKGLFWGDGDVTFKLPALAKDQKVKLLLGDASRPDGAKSTFRLEISADAGVLNATPWQGESQGQPLAAGKSTFKDKIEGQVLTVSRRGRFFIIRLGENNPHAFLVYSGA
jgi:hypothetical protein